MIICLILIAAAAGIVALHLFWWVYPKWLAKRHQDSPRDPTQKREDHYRLQASKALAGLLALGGFLLTAEQAIMIQTESVAARNKATQLAAYEHHQKALDSLTKSGKSTALHVGAIYTLASLANQYSEFSVAIANELAVTALSFPTSDSTLVPKPITPEAQASLKAIGGMRVMEAGLPLQLHGGVFNGAKIPNALLNGVDMPDAELSGADLYAAQLYNANLRYSSFNGTNLAGALLSHAAFYAALLCKGSNRTVSNLDTVDAVAVQLSGARLDDADFERAWLVDAILGSDKNAGAEDRTNMAGVNFTDASLRGADLSYSMLDGAHFEGADLTDVNLTGSSITNITDNENTRYCRTTWVDGMQRNDRCPTEPSNPNPSCVKNKTWRELESSQPHR